MTWQPGRLVITQQDRTEWQEWRREQKRQQQRERRARNPRIDYYPNKDALAVVHAECGRSTGDDYSSVLDRIVTEWTEHCHRN